MLIFAMRRVFIPLIVAALSVASAVDARAQMSPSDVVVRMEQLENQLRQMTGQVEQLQYRNQQLEQQLQRMREDNDYRFQELGSKGGPGRGAAPPAPAVAAAPPMAPPPAQQQAPGRRSDLAYPQDQSGPSPIRPAAPVGRGDVFDPNANPNAVGAPRPLGTLPPGQPSAPQAPIMADEPVGARGGREAGAPLDLSTMSGNQPQDAYPGGPLPPPPLRNPNATGAQASVMPPNQTPKDEFDLGYGSIQRKDYALAEDTFREFMRKYPRDRLAPDAQYWLGESLFQRQRYRDAADAFLAVSTKYETAARAPDALLRLGQSLAAMGEKETACATFGEVGRKYPRAPLPVKQGVEREQKRVRC